MKPLRIVVTGLIGSIPLPGLTYHYLQFALGLKRLGHDVHYLEETGTWNYSPASDAMIEGAEAGVRYLARVMDEAGLAGAWTFINHDGTTHGVDGTALERVLARADLFLNVTGANLVRDACRRIPMRVYLDTDPGFVQMRVQNGSTGDLEHLNSHNRFATFGGNIGQPDCLIPTLGVDWFATCQPVVPDLWPAAAAAPDGEFVTIMKWKSYDPVEFDGEVFGLKDTELEHFLELPQRVSRPLTLAVLGDGPRERFEAAGWKWTDAAALNASPAAYRRFLAAAAGEWSVAKSAYVRSHSGWFSDRSASLLGMGRPVVLQSTGFERFLPVGRGLLSFSSLDEAAAALAEVGADYRTHAAAAGELARAHFDYRLVLPKLLTWASHAGEQKLRLPDGVCAR
ncbi:MAG: hypothetical protein ACU85V_16305 [Gammaproteobacteria bacterium]